MIAGLALPIPRAADVALARKLGRLSSDESLPTPHRAKLTKREREICELAAQGLSNREIARHTGLKERTVETHLTASFRKVGVRSRSELAHFCYGPSAGTPSSPSVHVPSGALVSLGTEWNPLLPLIRFWTGVCEARLSRCCASASTGPDRGGCRWSRFG